MLLEIWTGKAILVSDRNEEHVTRDWRKGDLCLKW